MVMPDRTRAACWTLRIVLAAMCTGVALQRWIEPDAVSGLLYVDLRWCGERAADLVSATGAGLYAAAGLALLTPAARPAALWVALWTLVLVGVHAARDPYWPALVPGAWAVRWLAPLALWIWLGRHRRGLPAAGTGVEWGLRIAAAATFVCHGAKAAGLQVFEAAVVAPHAEYLDFLATLQRSSFGAALAQDVNERLLRAVGALDLTVALLLLAGRFRGVAAWMAAWGFATAALRLLEYGPTGPSRFLVRAPNGGVPLALLILWWRRAAAVPPPERR